MSPDASTLKQKARPFNTVGPPGRHPFVIPATAGIHTEALRKRITAATVSGNHFSGLRHLASLTADRFNAGLILYDGELTLPFGPKLWAIPISTFWQATFKEVQA